jgi:hypothetical protein
MQKSDVVTRAGLVLLVDDDDNDDNDDEERGDELGGVSSLVSSTLFPFL